MACLALIVAVSSCKKDNDDSQDKSPAPLSIEFDNIAGDQNLAMDGTTEYTNGSGEKFTVTDLRYFISNIKVTGTDGSEYTVPQDSSYFLIKENDEETHEAVVNVPQGDYNKISFVLGVDSLRSTMDISKRTGVLDPGGTMDESMYWGWNSGYIFFKMEGLSTAAPEDPAGEHKFRYHIGGFGGYSTPSINNLKTIELDLTPGGIVKVRKGRESNIHLMIDITKVFDGANSFKIADYPTVMFDDFSTKIADNLSGMFRHDHTEN
jgi:hypothetical protein